MLSFKHKQSIFRSYEDLKEKKMSNNRINYEYPKSLQRGKLLATQLNQNGNGYVLGKYMDSETIKSKGYKLDSRGWINIKDFSESELCEVIEQAMLSMSQSKSIVRKTSLTHVITENYNPKAVLQSISTDTVRSCLFNWLGYGNVEAPIWFIGMEEPGAENDIKALEESLKIRSQFEWQMDLCRVWEDLYGIPLEAFKDEQVWKYMAAFLLEFEEEEATIENIEEFIFGQKLLGREEGDHFLAVFSPLPKKKKKSIEPYQSIWENIDSYEAEITDKRLDLMKETIINHQEVQLLIAYDPVFVEKWVNRDSEDIRKISSWQLKQESFNLYKMKVSEKRFVYLLSTPLFESGHISYKGISDCVKHIKRIWQWSL